MRCSFGRHGNLDGFQLVVGRRAFNKACRAAWQAGRVDGETRSKDVRENLPAE